MAQKIKNASLWGRVGTGIGKGLAENFPEDMERGRLSYGLNQLNQQQNLNPTQQFAGLVGLTKNPQIIQTGGEILRQQAYLNSLKNQYEGQGGPKTGQSGYIPNQQEFNQPNKGELTTLATPEDTAQSYKTYIPPTEQQERQDAFENFNANPARYNYNFDNALNERKSITNRNQEIQKAHQEQEKTAVGKEEKVKTAFDNEAKRLGIFPMDNQESGVISNFDPKLYQSFEEKLLNSILPKSEGGEGKTQEEAIKKYSDQLLKAYENYKDLDTLSAWSPIEFGRRVNTIQKNLAPLGQEAKKVVMDKLIANYGVSPSYAAHKAYPIAKGEMPTINKLGIKTGTSGVGGVSIPRVNDATYAQLKKEMGKNNSPLSVAYELNQKSQDPRGFLNYLNNHRDDLEVWQAQQLDKNLNTFDLMDKWLSIWE